MKEKETTTHKDIGELIGSGFRKISDLPVRMYRCQNGYAEVYQIMPNGSERFWRIERYECKQDEGFCER